MAISTEELLARADRFLREDVAPHAERLDSDPDALANAVDGLFERQLMALLRPEPFGGPALDPTRFWTFQQSVARVSGALAFIQTQHQSAVGFIASSDNEILKSEYLPLADRGGKRLGVAFSQLRRPGPPMVTAREAPGGYVIDGRVPWVTGWTFFSEFVIAAEMYDGRAVFAVAPFPEEPTRHVVVGETVQLAAMNSARTVFVDLHGLFVPAKKVLFVKPKGWIAHNDLMNVVVQTHFALGCALAALDVMEVAASRGRGRFVKDALAQLKAERDACDAAIRISLAPESNESTEERVNLRAWAIELACRCAHGCVVASGGSAVLCGHSAQRILRESMVFGVTAQTDPIVDATLKRLSNPRR